MALPNIFLDGVIITHTESPTKVIQVDANNKLEIWDLLEQSDRQRFALSNTTRGLWTISSVTGSMRISTDGANNQLVVSSSSTSETEWYLDFYQGVVGYGVPVTFRSRTPENLYMSPAGCYLNNGNAVLPVVSNLCRYWTLVKPK
jgi:hypothetical protein